MSAQRRALISLAVALFVWTVYSWPLPRHVFHAIPSSAQNTEKGHVRTMIAGDHLQLLYQFWLAGDMIRGKTRFFHNLYEFNTGDDHARFKPKGYYFPFSFIFFVGEAIGGRAFGWNFAGFVSLWATYLLTWLLARRYTRSDGIAAGAALIGLVFPFRWINLLGGSPMGYAMVCAPAIMLGVDMAVRDRRALGGILAGVAVLFASWSDSHMFFFGCLLIPAWCAVALVAALPAGVPPRQLAIGWIRALWPAAVLALLALALNKITMSEGTAAVMGEGGRSWREAGMFSPVGRGLFSWSQSGVSGQIYLGYVLPVLLLAGAAFLAFGFFRRPPLDGQPRWRMPLLFALLALGTAGILALALGTHGPLHGKLFLAARKLIPPYTMIRQPAKIYCLLPSLLALMSVLSWNALSLAFRKKALTGGLALWALLLVGEYRLIVSPTLCRLDSAQPAYRAVADDAAAAQATPRLLVLPLWPGDSHWASLYEHYVSLYRIRMVNGYHPVVQKDYKDGIFDRLEGANKGWLPDEDIEFLLKSGIRYIALHENAFPEKVSPFPMNFTLQQLLRHPRLRMLTCADGVWAFKITAADAPGKNPSLPDCAVFFPARRWEAESLMGAGTHAAGGETPESPRYAALRQSGDVLETHPVRVPQTAGLSWMLRLRGEGTIAAWLAEDGKEGPEQSIVVTNANWTWVAVSFNMAAPYASVSGLFRQVAGSVDIDLISLVAGEWRGPAPGESLTIPAPCFFHAGATDPLTGEVILTAGRDPSDVVFYGLRLPLEPGTYAAEMTFASPAARGVELGDWMAGAGKVSEATPVKVAAGQRAVCEWVQADNRPCQLSFRFMGHADIRIKEIRLTRVE